MAQPLWGFECQSFQLSSCPKIRQRHSGASGRSEFRSFPHWINSGWEIQSFQPSVRPKIRQRYPGIKGKSSFAIFRTVRIIGTVRDSVGVTASYSVIATQR